MTKADKNDWVKMCASWAIETTLEEIQTIQQE